MPPKSTETFSTERRATSRSPPKKTDQPPQPLRHQHHDDDKEQAEDETRRVLDAAQQFGNDDVEGRAHDRASDRSEPADHDHAQEGDGKADAEILGMDVTDEIGKQAPGDRRI